MVVASFHIDFSFMSALPLLLLKSYLRQITDQKKEELRKGNESS